MAEISKQALKVDNNQSFPNNNNGAITPSILRAFNTNMIDSMVDEISYNVDSASWNRSISSLNAFTASAAGLTTGSLLVTASASSNVITFTKGDGSQFNVTVADTTNLTPLNQFTASAQVSLNNLNLWTSSYQPVIVNLQTSQSIDNTKWNTLGGQTGSYATSAITASSLVTASVNLNTITFTKGDASTFNITVNTGSGGGGSTDITSLNAFTASQETKDTTLASVTSSLNTATASLFTSTSLALVTASFDSGTRNLTFTKGNTTQFSVIIPDTSGSAATTIFEVVYTGENITKGDPLYISGSQGANPIVYKADAADPNKMPVTFVSNETIGVNNTTNAIILGLIEGINLTGYTAGQSIYVAEGGGWSTSLPSGSNSVTQLLGVVTKAGSGGKGLVLNPGPAQLPGLDTGKMWVGGSTNQAVEITTASFATTGSNTFIGNETFQDAAGNASTLVPTSGSLMFVAKTFTSASSHMTASANNFVNLIFKNNDNTGDTIISGSNNIFVNATTASAGFKRYIGGNGSIAAGPTHLPQISASMAFPVTMNNNILNSSNGLTMRGPVSSSTWTLSSNYIAGTVNLGINANNNVEKIVSGLVLSGNTVAGNLNIVANREFLTSSMNVSVNNINGTAQLNPLSSSVSFTNNTIADTSFNFTNNYYTSSAGVGAAGFNRNLVLGSGNTFLATGIGDAGVGVLQPAASQNIIGGSSNSLFTNATGVGNNNSIFNNIIFGNTLIVSGSSNQSTTNGSAFLGRYNANDGVRNSTGGTILAVGTGTAAGARKTGFLIDSGSNTFVEGTFNVSGSSSFNGNVNITGSLLVNGVAPVIPVGTVSSSAQIVAYNIFATTGSNSFNGNQTITGSLILSSSAATELIVIGNSEFTGSVNGNVVSMSITSNTASMDFSIGNYFELTASVSPLNINVTNLKGGTTKTLSVSGSTASTITFSPNVQQPSGSLYTASVSGQTDILSFVAFNSSKVNVVSTLKMV